MSLVSSITSLIASYLPFGLSVHPSFSVKKVSEGHFDIVWSVVGLSGTNRASLVIEKDTFTLSGDLKIIGSDSVFPFNVAAQIVNSTLQSVVTGALKAPNKSTKLLPLKSRNLIDDVVKGPVGKEVDVPAVTETAV